MRMPSPSSSPQLHRSRVNGISLAWFEWRPELRGKQATLLMVHATGFHGRVWDQVIAHFPDRHVIALEQRGHGRSDASAISDWDIFGEDLAEFMKELGLSGVVGVGHSMGAVALVLAAAKLPQGFERLVMIDPVIFDPEWYKKPPIVEGAVHPAAKRLNLFESPQAMMDRFADRPPYAWFTKAALKDFCDHALVPVEDGSGYSLACAPLMEASVYMTAFRNGSIFESIRAVNVPVLLIRAKLPSAERRSGDFSSSPTWPGLVSEFPNAREIYLADHTHLVPMQDPAGVAKMIQDAMAGL